jgi:hypothetical protein
MACSSHSSRMPCSVRMPSKDEPTLPTFPFLLFLISKHLLHPLERESQVLGRRLLRFLTKPSSSAMRSRATRKITRAILPSVRSLRTHRPQDRPQAARPTPYRPVADGGFVEGRRKFPGAVDQSSLCPKWHMFLSQFSVVSTVAPQ